MQVIGTGVGRTGTYSLKLALNHLGLGPCHHMEAVIGNRATQVPLWAQAVEGRPDWQALYEGFHSAVDWPTACFFRELTEVFPRARFVLTHRDPESWADSYASTIQKLVDGRDAAPPEMRDWLEMVSAMLARNGFPPGLDRDGLVSAFNAHNAAVRQAIPAGQLLVYEVRQGWEPLCGFLRVPVPDAPFPRTNQRVEFWDLVQGSV